MLKHLVKTLSQINLVYRQIFLFLIVGSLCYLVALGLLILFVEATKMEVNLANLLSSIIAIYVAYILNAKFIFEQGRHQPKKEISIFFLFSFLGLILNIILMFILTSYTPIHYVISKTFVTLVVAIFNFSTRKFLVFNK